MEMDMCGTRSLLSFTLIFWVRSSSIPSSREHFSPSFLILLFNHRYYWVSHFCLTHTHPHDTYPAPSSTLYSMAKFAGLRDPVTLDFEGSSIAYCIDAFSISMGALMGVSPVTAYIESATGISGGCYFYLDFRRVIRWRCELIFSFQRVARPA